MTLASQLAYLRTICSIRVQIGNIALGGLKPVEWHGHRENNLKNNGMEYTRTEQEAIVSVLYNLAQADYLKHDAEMAVYQECLKELKFSDESFVPCPKDELQSKTFETLKRLPKEKKHDFSLMMTKIARSDGEFGVLERKFVTEILEMCNIPFVAR